MIEVVYPPRPEGKIAPNRLVAYEKTGRWVAQRKFNGTHIVLYVHGDTVKLGHKGREPKQFRLTGNLKNEILNLNFDPNLKYWLDGELLDAKTKSPGYKGKIVLYDLIQAGKYFFGGPTLLGRLKLLNEICRQPQVKEPGLGIALAATENIWMAETFDHDFSERFKDFLSSDEIEGLVLKKKDSVIKNYGKKEYEVNWLIRCRKPTKNYTI
ncbi:MAG: hypothetical protein DWQ19_09725 [Crenarchaeota archaeon]|nr:MAG: hypothetical protein DWQ19_09725 [Thermoproteota archaeon]